MTGRNDPCPCGSGEKYKKCCLGKTPQRDPLEESQVAELLREMEDALPIPAFPTPELRGFWREQGKDAPASGEVFIDHVFNSGHEMGGIVCGLRLDGGDPEEARVCSLTHLKIHPEHPLRRKVEAYQKARVLKLRAEHARPPFVRPK